MQLQAPKNCASHGRPSFVSSRATVRLGMCSCSGKLQKRRASRPCWALQPDARSSGGRREQQVEGAAQEHRLQSSCSRRSMLIMPGLAWSLASLAALSGPAAKANAATEAPAAAESQGEAFTLPEGATVLKVSPSGGGTPGSYPTIAAALAAANGIPKTNPVAILVSPGVYRERLVLERRNTLVLAAEPQGPKVELVWETQEPYQSVVDCAVKGVVLRGLTLRHASKSVANNYGVFIHGGSDLQMHGCDITSTTGAGVGIEGAAPTLTRCTISGCARQGISIFGPLDLGLGFTERVEDAYAGWGGIIEECIISRNALDGVMVRAGASPKVINCRIDSNRGAGISLQDCGGELRGNRVYGNARGPALVLPSFDLQLDVDDLGSLNSF